MVRIWIGFSHEVYLILAFYYNHQKNLTMIQKFFTIVLIISIAVAGCKKADKASSNSGVSGSITLTELYNTAENEVDNSISVQGVVNHVCQHSGKRCFLVDSITGNTIRVEARGNIGVFSQDLVGADILVRGVLREKQLDTAYINNLEKETLAEMDTAADKAHCNAELENIAQMRDWMKEHNKPYYAVYFIEGNDYTVIE